MSYNIIGRKFVLWRTKYSNEAYTDQAGLKHNGYIVYEQIPVTVIETRKVQGMFGTGIHDGWKAVSDTGEEFTNNWHSYPDDSMTPTYYWDAREDKRGTWQPVDACQAFNFGFAHVHEDGTRCYPIGATVCLKHKRAHLDEKNCFECEYEARKKSDENGKTKT
jgi:hypothetical protein